MNTETLNKSEIIQLHNLLERAIFNKQLGFGYHVYSDTPFQNEIAEGTVKFSRNLEACLVDDEYVEITLEKEEYEKVVF